MSRSYEKNFLTKGRALLLKLRRMTAIGNFYFQHQLKDSLRFPPSVFMLLGLPRYSSSFCLKGLSSFFLKNLGTKLKIFYLYFGIMFDELSLETFYQNFFQFFWIICTASIRCPHLNNILHYQSQVVRNYPVMEEDQMPVVEGNPSAEEVGWIFCWWRPE